MDLKERFLMGRVEYTRQIKVVQRTINEWNPLELVPDAPEDEFDGEAIMVYSAFIKAKSVSELAEKIRAIFTTRLGHEFSNEECFKVAKQIWEELKTT
jgi:hypothetical protein